MNQILYTYEENKNSFTQEHKSKKKSTFFKVQFIACSIIAVSITSYYGYILYENNKKENISQKLLNNFNVTTLYNNAPSYSTSKTSSRKYVYIRRK